MSGQARLFALRYPLVLLAVIGLVRLGWAVTGDWDFVRILSLAEQQHGPLG